MSSSSNFSVSSGCSLQRLPIAIYQSIQEYIDDTSYRHLVNTNRYLTQELKYQTVCYELKIDQARLNKRQVRLAFLQLEKFQLKVKNYSKQLKLSITEGTDLFLQYSSLFVNIYSLCIALDFPDVELPYNFDFNIFNNISKVSLAHFHRINRIRNGLQNIQELSLYNFPHLESIECPLVNMHKILVSGCPNLRTVSSIQKSKIVHFQGLSCLPCDLTLNQDFLDSFTYEHGHFGRPGEFQIFHSITFSLLKCVVLRNLVANPTDDFSVFVNIPSVTIQCVTRDSFMSAALPPYFPPFREFHGRYLSLCGFDLTSWENIVLSSVRELELINCVCSRMLSSFSNVKKVKLFYMHTITIISTSSFPNCTSLTIEGCNELQYIQQLFKIKFLKIQNCRNFEAFINFGRDENDQEIILRKILLASLVNLRDISGLRNVYDIFISNCHNIQSFDGFDQSILPQASRIVHIADMNVGNCKLSGLGNIGYLQLTNIENLYDGKGIHDIDHLSLLSVDKHFINFSNFHGIHKSVLMHSMRDLETFDGLAGVPRVALLFSLQGKVTDFTGLMNCGQVFCCDVFPLIREAEAFINYGHSSPHAIVFNSIKEFYVIKNPNPFNMCRVFFSWDKVDSYERTRLW